MAEPTRRSGLGRGLDAVIPSGPRETRAPLPPYEDPVASRLDDLVDEVRRLSGRVDDLVHATAEQARRRFWHRRCGARTARLVATARSGVAQLAGIGSALVLDVADLALGTARELLDAAFGAPEAVVPEAVIPESVIPASVITEPAVRSDHPPVTGT